MRFIVDPAISTVAARPSWARRVLSRPFTGPSTPIPNNLSRAAVTIDRPLSESPTYNALKTTAFLAAGTAMAATIAYSCFSGELPFHDAVGNISTLVHSLPSAYKMASYAMAGASITASFVKNHCASLYKPSNRLFSSVVDFFASPVVRNTALGLSFFSLYSDASVNGFQLPTSWRPLWLQDILDGPALRTKLGQWMLGLAPAAVAGLMTWRSSLIDISKNLGTLNANNKTNIVLTNFLSKSTILYLAYFGLYRVPSTILYNYFTMGSADTEGSIAPLMGLAAVGAGGRSLGLSLGLESAEPLFNLSSKFPKAYIAKFVPKPS